MNKQGSPVSRPLLVGKKKLGYYGGYNLSISDGKLMSTPGCGSDAPEVKSVAF